MIGTQLFEGQNVRFTAIDPEKDAVLHSTWIHDLRYADLQQHGTFHHLSAFEARKQFGEMLKESAEKGNQFYHAIRKKTDESLIGFVYFPEVAWSNGSVFMRLLIAENDDLQRYGDEVLHMTLEYIFHELNLYRVAVIVPEYNREMAELYEQVGFQLEVRMRAFYYRGRRLWDQLIYGCLLPGWQKKQAEAAQ
jgi:RimJ/RimL family protein N-acetyltransferase